MLTTGFCNAELMVKAIPSFKNVRAYKNPKDFEVGLRQLLEKSGFELCRFKGIMNIISGSNSLNLQTEQFINPKDNAELFLEILNNLGIKKISYPFKFLVHQTSSQSQVRAWRIQKHNILLHTGPSLEGFEKLEKNEQLQTNFVKAFFPTGLTADLLSDLTFDHLGTVTVGKLTFLHLDNWNPSRLQQLRPVAKELKLAGFSGLTSLGLNDLKNYTEMSFEVPSPDQFAVCHQTFVDNFSVEGTPRNRLEESLKSTLFAPIILQNT